MGSYKVEWKKSAERELRNIDPKQIPRIINAVESLMDDPFPPQHRKMRGSEQDYRVRVGDYRVIYKVDTKGKLWLFIVSGTAGMYTGDK